MAAIRRGRVPMIGGGQALVDLTHRSDAARAMRLAAAGPAGGVWNVTSGKAYAFRDLVRIAADGAGETFRPVPLPYRAAMGIAGALEGLARLRGGAAASPIVGDAGREDRIATQLETLDLDLVIVETASESVRGDWAFAFGNFDGSFTSI